MKLKTFISTVSATLGSILVLGACAKTNDVANSVGGDADRQVKQLAIRAKWTTNCNKAVTLADIFGLHSQIEKYDIGASLSKNTILFREDNCAQPAITIVENGNYELGNKAGENIYPVDERFDSVAITPANDDGVKALNLVAACGFTDWAVGQSKDVTGKSSDAPLAARCWTKTPRQVFDLVEITGSQLKLGLVKDGRDKSDASKRPTEIDQSAVLTKQ